MYRKCGEREKAKAIVVISVVFGGPLTFIKPQGRAWHTTKTVCRFTKLLHWAPESSPLLSLLFSMKYIRQRWASLLFFLTLYHFLHFSKRSLTLCAIVLLSDQLITIAGFFFILVALHPVPQLAVKTNLPHLAYTPTIEEGFIQKRMQMSSLLFGVQNNSIHRRTRYFPPGWFWRQEWNEQRLLNNNNNKIVYLYPHLHEAH